MILSDIEIRELAVSEKMIEPYIDGSIRQVGENKIISRGESSYGYDISISDEVGSCMVFRQSDEWVDPKNFDAEKHLVEPERVLFPDGSTAVIIPPNTTLLARSCEYMRMPKNVTGICLGKSTYARSGLTVLATPLEAGWQGHITLEIANVKPSPALVYLNEGFMQVVFLRGNVCETTYSDRNGKYQGQTGLTLPKV